MVKVRAVVELYAVVPNTDEEVATIGRMAVTAMVSPSSHGTFQWQVEHSIRAYFGQNIRCKAGEVVTLDDTPACQILDLEEMYVKTD